MTRLFYNHNDTTQLCKDTRYARDHHPAVPALGTAALTAGLCHARHLYPHRSLGQHTVNADYVRYGRTPEAGRF